MSYEDTYESKLETFIVGHADDFVIDVPGGQWSPTFEGPGYYFTWFPVDPDGGMSCPLELATSFEGHPSPNVANAYLIDRLSGQSYYKIGELDFRGRFTGDLRSDAELVQKEVRAWLMAHASSIVAQGCPAFVPAGAADPADSGRRSQIFGSFKNPAKLKRSLL